MTVPAQCCTDLRPRLVDTHCHVQDAAFDDDRAEALARARSELGALIVVGDDLESSRRALGLARGNVYAAVGMHPYHADWVGPAALAEIRDLAEHPGVVAIGETGLDYYRYSKASKASQRAALEHQLGLAREMGLPVIIHNRDAHEDLAEILDGWAGDLPAGVMHCFAGDPSFVERTVRWGFHISFAGNVTFPKAEALREAAREVPMDRLLVETDSPYLAPQPVRGRRCEPIHVVHTARVLAELHGLPFEEFVARTTENARRLFWGKPGDPRAPRG